MNDFFIKFYDYLADETAETKMELFLQDNKYVSPMEETQYYGEEMEKGFVSMMYRHTYFTLIIQDVRIARIFMSEKDKEKQYMWIEGYLNGIQTASRKINWEFDESEDNDIYLSSLFLR